MPKLSRWKAQHAGCQAAVDAVAADLRAEIERLQNENERLHAAIDEHIVRCPLAQESLAFLAREVEGMQ